MIYKIYTLNLYIYIHTQHYTHTSSSFAYSGVLKSESTTRNCTFNDKNDKTNTNFHLLKPLIKIFLEPSIIMMQS